MEENSMPKIVVNPRLRSIEQLFTDTFKLVWKQWAPLLTTQIIMMFAIGFVVVISIFVFMLPVIKGISADFDPQEFATYLFSSYFWIGLSIIIIPSMIISAWSTSSMIAAIGYKGEKMAPIGWALKRGIKFTPFMLIMMVLVGVANIGGMPFFAIPSIILVVGLSLSWYLVVNEDLPILKALGTSWEITRGYRWAILGRLALLILGIWGISVFFAIASMVPVMGIMATLVQFVFNLVIAPICIAYTYLIYQDIRFVRKENYSPKGGLVSLMIVCWIFAATYLVGLFFLISYLVQKYWM